jgi:glutamate---cysteine ligase / carboxylate-amine ligase
MSTPPNPPPPPSPDELRAAFGRPTPLTLGVEEELMLLDPETLDLVPHAAEVLARLEGDRRFKPELPAAQLEILTSPAARVSEATAALAAGRRDLDAAAGGLVRLAAAGAHPFAAPEGELNRGGRYDRTAAEYGDRARRQLVFALQVHVAPGSADRALAVYNALRSHLPVIAALAANAPFHGGVDTGLASVRPTISAQLPRQGVPPVLESWEDYAAQLAWGAAAGPVADPSAWWWELRPHPRFGTLELRVPDAQTTIADAGAVAAFVHCLVADLCRRHDEGERLPAVTSWRIAENRWWAARDGLDAELADLETGERIPLRASLPQWIDRLEPLAAQLGCADELAAAAALARENGAVRQRRVVADGAGPRELTAWLADRWLADR